MSYEEHVTQLKQFRQQVYQNFNKRADTLMDLVDALSSQEHARSVVELSLEEHFRRGHSALFKAISEWEWANNHLAALAGPHLPQPQQHEFWLLGMDVTPLPRTSARTLEDRGFVYRPTAIKGNKPITIGHQYSTVVLHPEKENDRAAPWVVPLSNRRIKTWEDKEVVGAEQIEALLSDESLPFHGQLCVEVEDSGYSKPAYLSANRHHTNLVSIVRSRSNRTYYHQPDPETLSETSGHPTWYGEAFSLKDRQTWHDPDEVAVTTHTSCRGRTFTVVIQAWHNMLMRGKRKPYPMPMHQYPFTLVRICLYDEHGKLALRRPLWLLVVSKRRHELSLLDIYHAYTQRFDIEHFFRFGKQKLLLDHFQTPIVSHEETWWQLAHLTYLQLWVAKDCAQSLPRPWERSLPAAKERITPTYVQRDMKRIIRQIGTPASVPKRRGYSPGWEEGRPRPRRDRLAVVKKT